MENSNECMVNENECEMIYGQTFDSNKKEIDETIECDQIINGKIYHMTLTYNKPSDKALSELANELIKIYNEVDPRFKKLEVA